MKIQLILASATVLLAGCHNCHSTQTKGFHAASAHADAGAAYRDSLNAALKTPMFACEWPDEYPGSDEPGAAYKESQAAAEDADCHEDAD